MTRIGKRIDERRQQHTGIALLGLMVLMLLAGCAHEKAFKRGTRLSEEGRYESAITELEEAVRLAEAKNKDKAAERYREKLAEVKKEAAAFFYNRAENRFTSTDLGEAQTLIERCVTYCPADTRYPAFLQRVRAAIAETEQRRTEALALADEQRWDEAIQRMQQALGQYRSMPGGDGDLTQIRERAYQQYLGRAEAALNNNDLTGAQAEAQRALGYKANGREANAVVKTVKDRREAADLIARARALLQQGNGQEALRLLERAQELYPTQTELPGLLSQARRAVCDLYISQGRQALEAGRYAAALQSFNKSHDLLAGYGGIGALLADTKSRLTQRHLQTSQQYLQNTQAGSAVVHAVAALGYEPGNFDARRQLGRAAGQVRDDVRYTVAFLGFRAAPEQRAMANSLASVALEHLTRTRPTNVTLLERADPQTVLDNPNASAPPAGLPAAAQEGIDAHLVGEILDSQIVTQTTEVGRGESTYQDGYRAEPNPNYVQAADEADEALRDLERARQRLAEAKVRLARYESADPGDARAQQRKQKAIADVAEAQQRLVNAATRVSTAQVRLVATPSEVFVPNMVQHEFPVEEVTWTAKISCMVKMLDAATGELILAEQVEGQHAQSDRMVAADEARNVPGDPLELPDDRMLLESAAKATMEKLKPSLSAALTRHGQRFATTMQRAETAGDLDQAVDNAVKYLFAYPKGTEHTNAMLDYVRRYLGAEDALLDLRALLRTHCQLRLK
jgi:tetratricopeptide (TPR) repeat protein